MKGNSDMNYAYPSNKPFFSQKPVDKKAVLTQDMQDRLNFIEDMILTIGTEEVKCTSMYYPIDME